MGDVDVAPEAAKEDREDVEELEEQQLGEGRGGVAFVEVEPAEQARRICGPHDGDNIKNDDADAEADEPVERGEVEADAGVVDGLHVARGPDPVLREEDAVPPAPGLDAVEGVIQNLGL